MADWDPVETPRTYIGGGKPNGTFMAGAVMNEERDRMLYLKGGAAPDGTFITLAESALAGDTAITATEIPADIPVGTVLHFRSGADVWARVNTEVEETDEETEISVDALAQNLAAGDIAAWPRQEVILIEAPLRVAEGLGAGRQHESIKHVHEYTDESTLGTRWWHLAQKVAALTDDDHIDLIFGIKNTAGTVEELGRIRFYRAGSAGLSAIHISTNSGAGFPATPAIAVRGVSNRVGINMTGPSYTLDIDGDLDISEEGELIGIALWKETPPGTLRHEGDAEIDGQYISTVATGTPPFVASVSSETVENLNVSTLEGHVGWLDDPVVNDDTATVTTPDTDETTATATATLTALHAIEGQCTLDVHADDLDCNFVLRLKLGADYIEAEPGRLRLTSARKHPFSVFGQVMLTATDVVELVVSKDEGTGSTAAVGNLTLTPIGSPG